MKTIDKSLKIFEYVLERNGIPVTPTEIAEAFDMHLATSGRIMMDLTKLGYLERQARRGGYVAGPVMYSLARRDSIYQRLIKASEAPLDELTALLKNMVVTCCVMVDGRRVMIYYNNQNPLWKPWPKTFFEEDNYKTPSGRLLLSSLPDKELVSVVERSGLPGDDWPEVQSIDDLRRELNVLAKKKETCYKGKSSWSSLHMMGALLDLPDYPPVAIGFAVSEEQDVDYWFERCRETKLKIENNLTGHDIFC